MLYQINADNSILPTDTYDDHHLFAGFFNEDEFQHLSQTYFRFPWEVEQQIQTNKKTKSRISKIDAYPEYYIGEIVMLNKDKTANAQVIHFLIKPKLLLIISDDEELRDYYHTVFLQHDEQINSLERLVFLFLDEIIQHDNIVLDSIQQTLMEIDEKVFKNLPMKFNHVMERPRKQIMILDHCYDHLLEIAEELVDNELELFDVNTRYLKILKDRINRLHNATGMLQEFMITIRESHQSNIDNDLNRTMKVLTVLTAIFQPLTLIVGWYGMNFTHMPELTWRYGYIFVILLSINSILLCCWIFKKKKIL